MHPFLLNILPLQISKVIGTKNPLASSSKPLHDFMAVMQKMRAALNGSSPGGNRPSRPDGAPSTGGPGKGGNTRASQKRFPGVQDLSPVATLLQEAGIPAARIQELVSALASGPESGSSLKDLPLRVRALLAVEKGGDGRLSLEPASRLRVESALIDWGLSPKEADRVISLSSTKEGKIDVEKFIRLTVLQRFSPAEGVGAKGTGDTELPRLAPRGPTNTVPDAASIPRNRVADALSGRVGEPAALTSTVEPQGVPNKEHPTVPVFASLFNRDGKTKERPPMPLGDRVAPKQGSGFPGAAHAESATKAGSPFSTEGLRSHGEGENRADRGKASGGPDAHAVRHATAEEGMTPSLAKTSEGPHPMWAKSVGTPSQPSPLPDDQVPAHVTAQVGRQISRALLNGDQAVRLHLSPPHLGVLKVQLEWKAEGLRLEMVTDRHPVRELLLASVSELKDALADQGYRVEKMEVQVNDSQNQLLFQSGRDYRDSAGTGYAPEEDAAFSRGDAEAEAGTGNVFDVREDRLIDLVA